MNTLVLIDVQKDFMPGGALAVPRGDTIVPVINKLQDYFDVVLATQDWHPKNHKSFASNHTEKKPFDRMVLHGIHQTLWPDHCVQGTVGAEFHKDLLTDKFSAIFRKGMDPEVDSYSGFYDNNHQSGTGLAGCLKDKGAIDLFFCGLAADICVYYTILDSILEGFSATLIEDASCPLYPEKFDDVKFELAKLGVHIINSHEIFKSATS
jgi:nicotinamidase/pyrazinamidase